MSINIKHSAQKSKNFFKMENTTQNISLTPQSQIQVGISLNVETCVCLESGADKGTAWCGTVCPAHHLSRLLVNVETDGLSPPKDNPTAADASAV
jgi:hypothetical protein